MRRPPVNAHWREGDTHLLLDYPRTVSVNTPFRLHLVLPSDPDSKVPKIPKPNNGVLNFVEREEVIIEADKENLWSSELRYVEYVFEAIAHEKGDFIIPAFEIDYTFLEGGKHKRKVEELKVHVASARNDVGSQNRPECRQMLDVATPEMFRINAFRITGLPVDATTREITKHADKLKMMEELGEGKSVHTGALALKTPPTVDQIREAIQRLKDPELRIIDEFFWFWPRQFGKSSSDPAFKALESGDADAALEIWKALETSSSDGFIAMHNVAVLRHLLALEWENHYAKTGEFTEANRRKTEKMWRAAFKRWDLLATDDLLWESVSARIKQLDDPRLTSGFARRMRATLPHALDKINAELAVRYAEGGRIEMARVHVQFMRETNEGLDNIEKTAELVLVPVLNRLKQQIQRAKDHAAKDANGAATAVRDLLKHAGQTGSLFALFLGSQSSAWNDFSDEVATVCNRLQLDYHKATNDDTTCLTVLKAILPFAASPALRQLIERNISVIFTNVVLEPIRTICEEVSKTVQANPASGEDGAHRVFSTASQLLPKLTKIGLPREAVNKAQDEVALILMHCAVAFGNKTDKWKPCIPILEQSLRLAVDSDLRERVTKNLETVRRNGTLYGNLSPITSAPSLNTTNGIGFTLYGCTDKDATTGSYLATYYFVIFALPLFPISRYRVVPSGNGYRFFGKAPLRTGDKWHIAIFIGLIVWWILAVNSSGSSYGSRPSVLAPKTQASYNTPAPTYATPSPTHTKPSLYIPPTPKYSPPSPKLTAPSPIDVAPSKNKSIYSVPSYINAELDIEGQSIAAEKEKTAGLVRRLDNAKQVLESEKIQSSMLQKQIEVLKSQVDVARIYLDTTNTENIDAFNRKVDNYNASLAGVRTQSSRTNQAIDGYNTILEQVRLQEHILNRKVKDYNIKLQKYGR